VESEINIAVKAGHAGRILPVIDRLLEITSTQKDDLELIAVGCGPGSFTGIRIGIATAKGLSMALGCPITGISSLDALAYAAVPSTMPVMPVIDARKSEIYCCLYSAEGLQQTPYMNIRPEEAVRIVKEETLFLGNGVSLYEEVLQESLGSRFVRGPKSLWNPRASVIGCMAEDRIARDQKGDVEPIYVRASDATLTLKKNLQE